MPDGAKVSGIETPRLYLATPPLDDARGVQSALEHALMAGDAASLLIRFATEDARKNEGIVRALAPIAQAKGVAVIVEAEPNVALRAGADGAHIRGASEDLTEAVKKLSPKYSVGAGALYTRDDAMRAGEAGADYVMLEARSRSALIERVAWWSELFNTPCVARAETLDDIAPLAQAGADFILLDDAIWNDPRGPAAAVEQALKELQGAQA